MKFASEFILIYPLSTIMFGERGGLSAARIGSILAIGFILSVVFEIPTGIIADKIPRKYVLISAIVTKILALAAWLAYPSYTGYLTGVALFACAAALESGALQAYLYGTLGEESKKSFGKFWARVSAMIMVSYTSAYVLASLIGVRYPLLISLSISACIVALVVSLGLPTDSLAASHFSSKPRIFRSAFAHILETPLLIRLLLEAVIIVALAEVVIEYSSLYYHQVGIMTRYVPLVLALGNIIGAFLFWTLHGWENALNRHKITFLALMCIIFIFSFFGNVGIAIAGFLIVGRFMRVLQVQFEVNLQHLANEQTRATVTSIGAFSAKLAAAAIAALVGIFATMDHILIPIRVALLAGAGVFIGVHLLLSGTEESPSP